MKRFLLLLAAMAAVYCQQFGDNPNTGTQYNRDDPYNRDQNPYNRDNNSNNRDNQYGNTPYGNNRDQYGNNQYGNNNSQRYDNNNNRDRYNNNNNNYDPNKRYNNDNQYNRDNNTYNFSSGNNNYNQQYGNNNPQYNNRQLDNNNNNRQYDNNNQYNNNNNNDRYNTNNDRFNTNSDRNFEEQYGNNRQFGNNDNTECCEEYCYTDDREPYIFFASKTSYEALDKRSGFQHNIPDCTPVQMWSLNRHGTRLPGRRTIEALRKLQQIQQEIVKNHEERRSYPDKGRLCPKDYDLLKRWRWNDTIREDRASDLTSEGVNELKMLARRYKAKFPQVLQEQYNERSYYFQYTDTDRTHDSYQAYIDGLFNQESYRVHGTSFPDDRLLKAFDTCRAYKEQVKYNPRTYEQHRLFTERPEYRELVSNVFKRLGFRYTLNASIVDDMYDMCRFEKAWNVLKPSPWCSAFNKNQLKLLEYAEDLISYYEAGYGNEINQKVGCGPLKDMYERFQKTVDGYGDGNKATFLFTHSDTIAATLSAMGIAKDPQPLRADNYYQQTRRMWKQSNILPYASNLVAVLYQCRSNSYKVMFYLNEQPVEFPECQVGLCNWDVVKQKYQYTVDNCNMGFCDYNSAPKPSSPLLAFTISAIVCLLFNRAW
ncbi:unnamed protein product [Brassicogethes aeneus]|uniref:Multiple inositol polyphosphate phosphatase 1 n=1 Tax=Brassicogethes aeneus TaxID=1431903 RepID=A0A9P0BI53_BRAAE|nr:unnamed protein product [Brassicogethes aeneus]